MNTLLKMFRKPTIDERKQREIHDAEHLLLEAHTAKEYAESVIAYNNARLARLVPQAA